MSYNSVESALATIIKKASGYSATNVAQGDYRVLAKGNAKAVILQPGAFIRSQAAESWKRSQWNVNVEIYIAFGGEISTVAGNIRTERQSIIDKIDQYPTLDSASGVVLAELAGGGEPEMWQIGAQQFWKQVMICRVEERALINVQEDPY